MQDRLMHDSEPTVAEELGTASGVFERGSCPALVVLSGPEAGFSHMLCKGRTVIGRHPDADVTIDHAGVSRSHAELELRADGRCFLRDLDSTNGTRLGSRRVGSEPVLLRDGDRLRLGQRVVLKLSWQDSLEKKVNDRLFSAAIRDALTGIYNRAFFNERFAQDFAHASCRGSPLSLIMIDLDHFKAVNDGYGHVVGDRVLCSAARYVRFQLRRGDLLARYGGEEFVALLRDTGLEEAVRVADRARAGLAALPLALGGRRISITASMGVTSTGARSFSCPEEMLARADMLLYRAKDGGRDRVVADLPRDRSGCMTG